MIPKPVAELHDEGWSLIPVGPDKKPLTPWKAFQEYRASKAQLEQWQARYTPAIWAGVTGGVSGRISLDFDAPHGPGTMRSLGLSPHRSTPNSGFHVDVYDPGWHVPTLSGKTKRSLGTAFPGLDIRASGGYINLHGSTTTGNYVFLTADHDHAPLPLEALPENLRSVLGLLTPPPEPQATTTTLVVPSAEGVVSDRLPSGEDLTDPTLLDTLAELTRRALTRVDVEGRNNSGFWLACQLRDRLLSRPAAELSMAAYAMSVPAMNSKGILEPYLRSEAFASLDQAWSRPPRAGREARCLPRIYVSNRQLRDLTADAVAAMVTANDPPVIFTRGAAPTRIVRSDVGHPSCEILKTDSVLHVLSRVANWVTPGAEEGAEPRNVFPPTAVAKDLLAREWSELPRLSGIIDAPCLRPDGSLLTEPGWDDRTGLWLDPSSSLVVPIIPVEPTGDDLNGAVSLVVDELLGEFAFTDQPSRANAVALVLTAVLRPAIPGLVPMALLNAPVAGSGKTLLINTAAQIATGRQAALTAAPSRDDEELRKRITSLLMAGDPIVVFDNVGERLTSSVLAQALTAPVWGDRVLGRSQMLHLEQRAVWAATGNNLQVGGDLARRCYPINLDPRMAQPWRRDFRRPDLDRWVDQHRGDLLRAVLIIGRSWFARGRPDGGSAPWGTYHGWAQTLAGMLSTAGVAGFLDNLDELHDGADVETAGWLRLLSLWRDHFNDHPIRVAELADLIATAGDGFEPPPSIAAALGYARDSGTRNTRLAAKLKAIADRRFDDTGLRIERSGSDPHTKNVLWRAVVDTPVIAPVVTRAEQS